MRLGLICGSLESGKDGVGDYVRMLSGYLIRTGHTVVAIALNDRHLSSRFEYSTQTSAQVDIQVLRVSPLVPSKEKILIATEFLNRHKIKWLSLQYVPYAFSMKGVPLNLIHQLRKIGEGKEWHFFFHELWLDSPRGWKQQLTLVFQRVIAKLLLSKLRPKSVQCSITYNQQRLSAASISSDLLPLFGNIALATKSIESIEDVIKSDIKKILYFGSAPKGQSLSIIIDGLQVVSETLKGKVVLIIVGFDTLSKANFINELKHAVSAETKVIDVGFQSDEAVAYLLQHCDVGISRSSNRLLGKSGTAMAMLEFGLPIWMPSLGSDEMPDTNFRRDLIFKNLHEALSTQKKYKYEALLPLVADKLVNSLKS